MNRIKYKPISVNRAWQGRRFKSDGYKIFKRDLCILLTMFKKKLKNKLIGKPLFAHYRWGVSNFRSDVDNPTKPFQDVLFDRLYPETDDHKVEVMLLEKVPVKKGDEFIEFHVDDRSNLIPYLEDYIEYLKREGKDE